MRLTRIELWRAVVLTTAVLAVLVLASQTVLGALAVGIAVDDPTHVDRFEVWLRDGWYVPSDFVPAGAEPQPGTRSTPFVYAPAFSTVAHLANTALGNEGIGEIAATAAAYEVRHLVVAVLALLTAGGVGIAVRALTRDRVAASWSVAALLAIPVWTGNGMFNIKDIPVATGYTAVTVGLVLALVSMSRSSSPPRSQSLAVAALIAFGVFIGVGTRAAMWLPFFVSVATFGALSAVMLRSPRAVLRSLAAPGIGFAVGLAGVAALYPRAAATPIDWLTHSVSDSSDYQGGLVGTLTAGELLSTTAPPAWYLPAWTFAAVPVIILGIAVFGIAALARGALRWRSIEPLGAPARARIGGMFLVATQLLLLPVAAGVGGSSMYGGLRQHLYVLPAVAILAGIGAAAALRAVRASRGPTGWRWATTVALVLAVVVPAVQQTLLYPYNYVYVNPIAALGGVQDRWETELQAVSGREALRSVPPTIKPVCSPFHVLPQASTPEIAALPCPDYPPFRDEVGSEATTSARKGEVWVIGRVRAGNHPPAYCEEHGNVTRPLHAEEIAIAYVLQCPRSSLPRSAALTASGSAGRSEQGSGDQGADVDRERGEAPRRAGH